MENGAFDYFDKLDAMGGMVKAIESGYPQKEIAEASYQFQRAAEAEEKVIVGANEFTVEEPSPQILYIDETVANRQTEKLKSLRQRGRNEEVGAPGGAEESSRAGAQGGARRTDFPANTMPYIIEAVRAYATVGEICEALREVYGTYEESAFA